MTFTEFFQQNIIFFVAGIGILFYLMFLEIKGLKTRGLDLTSAALTQRVNAGATLIDLRSQEDYQAGHITGAKNIVAATLPEHLDSLGNKDDAIVLYCYAGKTSANSINTLQKAGFTNVSHLAGGMAAWKNDGLPVNKA